MGENHANLAVNGVLGPKFSSPAARFKGLRLGDRVGQPRIGHPGRHHHAVGSKGGVTTPGQTQMGPCVSKR